MDKVAAMSDQTRFDLFQETSARSGLPDWMVEKDFWVCWSLHRLFGIQSALPATLLFKGGTSLSKVYHAINRFSEDVDLSLEREDLGFSEKKDPYSAPSKKQEQKLLEELTSACKQAIQESLLPALENDFSSILGEPNDSWNLVISEEDPQTLLFGYPRLAPVRDKAFPTYVKPSVRLEIGARSDHWPVQDGSVKPFAAEHFPQLFVRPKTVVRTLSAERTFWEKITLLHALHHLPPGKPLAARLSRHYYDIAQLYRSPIGERALEQGELLSQVVKHKNLFFRSGWAHYQTAVPGSLKLIPTPERIPELKKDYRDMEAMIFGDKPSFEELLQILSEIEKQINT
jgi:hypothetical protein